LFQATDYSSRTVLISGGLKQRYMKGRPSCGWLSSKNDDQQRLRVEPTKGASYEV
jgi:hypothetical protein